MVTTEVISTAYGYGLKFEWNYVYLLVLETSYHDFNCGIDIIIVYKFRSIIKMRNEHHTSQSLRKVIYIRVSVKQWCV